MPCGHDGAVMLMVERGAAKVDHAYGRVLHRPLFSLLTEINLLLTIFYDKFIYQLNITQIMSISKMR